MELKRNLSLVTLWLEWKLLSVLLLSSNSTYAYVLEVHFCYHFAVLNFQFLPWRGARSPNLSSVWFYVMAGACVPGREQLGNLSFLSQPRSTIIFLNKRHTGYQEQCTMKKSAKIYV